MLFLIYILRGRYFISGLLLQQLDQAKGIGFNNSLNESLHKKTYYIFHI